LNKGLGVGAPGKAGTGDPDALILGFLRPDFAIILRALWQISHSRVISWRLVGLLSPKIAYFRAVQPKMHHTVQVLTPESFTATIYDRSLTQARIT